MRIEDDMLNIDFDLYDKMVYEALRRRQHSAIEHLEDRDEHNKAIPPLIMDVFNSLYKFRPQFRKEELISWDYIQNREILKGVMQNVEWSRLRTYTRLDELQATVGTVSMINYIAQQQSKMQGGSDRVKQMKTQMAGVESAIQGINNQMQGSTPGQKSKLQKQKRAYQNQKRGLSKKINNQNKQIKQDRDKMMDGFGDAIKDTIKDIKDIGGFVGWGDETGTENRTGYKQKIMLANSMAKNPKLKQIAKLAGRFKRIAEKKFLSKMESMSGEVEDIYLSDDVYKLTSSEMLGLVDPDLLPLFTQKYLDKKLQTFRVKNKHEKGLGPIIICIDVSGSMNGNRDIWAKAVAAALVKIATVDKREIDVVMFDTDVKHRYTFNNPDEDSNTTSSLVDMLTFHTGGGTNFNAPLKETIKILKGKHNMRKADLIFITDGEAEFSDDVKENILGIKKEIDFAIDVVFIHTHKEYIKKHAFQEIANKCISVDNLSGDVGADLVAKQIDRGS